MENTKQISSKDIRKIREYINSIVGLYANIAMGNIETLCGMTFSTKELEEKRIESEKKKSFAQKMHTNFFFIERLIRDYNDFEVNKNQVNKKEEAECIEVKQADTILEWMRWIDSIRNFHSHNFHIEREVKYFSSQLEVLESFYLEALVHCKTHVPQKYANALALYRSVELQDPKDSKKTKRYLSLTGYVFIICLFLNKDDVNAFLEAIEQAHFSDFNVQEKREEYRYRHPREEFPEKFRVPVKLMLYARQVYTHWANRGHRSYLPLSEGYEQKEICFSILEYLKRMPQDRLVKEGSASSAFEDYQIQEREGSETDRRKHYAVLLNDKLYDVREKNKFMEWALAYWEEEFKQNAKDSVVEWEWGHHCSADEKKEVKRRKEADAANKSRVSEKVQRLCRHEKVVWGVPEEQEVNDRNDEIGYPFYFERDEQGVPSQALFKCSLKQGENTKTIVGLMGRKLLAALMELYLSKFPVENNKIDHRSDKKGFFEKVTKACIDYVETTYKGSVEKNERENITPEKIQYRIGIFEQELELQKQETSLHKRILFIADTWNKMLMCGASNNRAHALDEGRRIGCITGYREIIKRLSVMAPTLISKPLKSDFEDNERFKMAGNNCAFLEQRRKQSAKALFELLGSLGKAARQEKDYSYLERINKALNFNVNKNLKGVTDIKLETCTTIKELFDQCMNYHEDCLNYYRNKLKNKPFQLEEWGVNREMRYLGLRDARTPKAVNLGTVKGNPRELSTGILNVDQHLHTAVGMPSTIAELHYTALTNMLSDDKLTLLLKQDYPSPGKSRLIIEEFYCPDNLELWRSMARPQRGRLYQVRKEDTILSHLAYYYGQKSGYQLNNARLSELDYQKQELYIDTDHSDVKISFYYRHYKQSRYRLNKKVVNGLVEMMLGYGLISEGEIIPYNNLMPMAKSELTDDDKILLYDEQKEWNLTRAEKLKLINAKLEQAAEVVFVPKRTTEKGYYLLELLHSYNCCRKAFIDKILKFESLVVRKYKLEFGSGKRYLDFAQIRKKMVEKGVLTMEVGSLLNVLRNPALHNVIPKKEFLPNNADLVALTNTQTPYFDLFKRGLRLIEEKKA